MFKPTIRQVGRIKGTAPVHVLKDEPMLFSASVEFAMEHGGPLTKAFLSSFEDEALAEAWVIDTKVHMLMPGWWPCIPGWHHDDVVRSREDGQPNYEDPRWEEPVHRLVVVDNGTDSHTEFLTEPIQLEIPAEGVIYREWDAIIGDRRRIKRVEPGVVYEFGTSDFHRGVPAKGNGWRFFARASRNTTRTFLNEIRSQTQVYLSYPEAGW
jgi:hypothetical protein